MQAVCVKPLYLFAAERLHHRDLIQLVQAHPGTLQQTEAQKLGGLAVPDTDEEERHEEADDTEKRLDPGLRKAAHQSLDQRSVNVDLPPVRKRHMPPAPEFEKARGRKGTVEILRQVQAEDPGASDHQIDEAGEIEIKIHRVKRWNGAGDHQFFAPSLTGGKA